MALLSLTASVRVTGLNPFRSNPPDSMDHDFEGDSTVEVHLTATPVGNEAVMTEGLEWWCGDGGWVAELFIQNAANPWWLGGTIAAAGADRTWSGDCYDPIEHVVFQARAEDPTGVQQPEWTFTQAPVAVDGSTAFAGAIETAPPLLSPPQFPLDLTTPVFIAVRGPVEAYDLVTPSGGGLVRERTLVVAGQIVNWFKDAAVLEAITNPAASTERIDLKISIDDHTAGRMVVSESCFDAASRSWRRDLGNGEGSGFELLHDDRVAAFLVHCVVPETFSFGTLILEFIWPGGGVKRSVAVATPAVDVLYWPVKMGPEQRLQFTNGLSARFNTHTRALHQHLAYDITSWNGDDSNASMAAALQAVASGTIREFHDDEPDRAAGAGGGGRANRVFMQFEHPDTPRYAVYAHVRSGSANRSTARLAAGSGVGEIGNNGGTSGEHLHLLYYELNRFGRLRLLPMAFALRAGAGSETLVGVPGDGVRAFPGTTGGVDDPIVDKLEVHVTTGSRALGGTNDDVSVAIGGRLFNLDNPSTDDFESGSTNVFLLPPWSGARVSDLRGEIQIRKSPDGPLGGWNLDGVKVVVNGATLFDAQGLDTWLSSAPWVNRLVWTGTIT
jgi:hypothetical protein